MQHDPLAWLSNVRDAADRIATFITDRTFNDYETDPMFRSPVENQLELVGEALNQFSKEAPDFAARIPNLRAAVAMRWLMGTGQLSERLSGNPSRAAFPSCKPVSPHGSTTRAPHRNSR